jgi:putative membrane protein
MGSSGSPTAQPGTGTRNTPDQSRLARADRRFIEQASASGLHELQAAQLATTRATDPAVKDYAAMIAQHQGSANSELSQLAATLGVELPAAPPRAMRNELERLAKRTGAEFDREFVREIGIKEHERDIKRFQAASKEVKEPQLKAWIDKTLPVLQQHLSAAQKLPQAGSEAAASTRTQQERMGAGSGGYGSGSGSPGLGSGSGGSPGGAGSGDSGSGTGR